MRARRAESDMYAALAILGDALAEAEGILDAADPRAPAQAPPYDAASAAKRLEELLAPSRAAWEYGPTIEVPPGGFSRPSRS
jgi:hypothetical protein